MKPGNRSAARQPKGDSPSSSRQLESVQRGRDGGIEQWSQSHVFQDSATQTANAAAANFLARERTPIDQQGSQSAKRQLARRERSGGSGTDHRRIPSDAGRALQSERRVAAAT